MQLKTSSEHVLETLENYLSFLLMNESINESSVSRKAHPPLKKYNRDKIPFPSLCWTNYNSKF